MDLGIDLTAATLSEYALAQGITKSYNEMTQAEKVMLRYQYLMSVTEKQQGDFQLTSLSYANSLRTLKANFAALGTQIGSGLVAAIRPAIVALNTLMKYLLKAATAFATFMKTLFPFTNGSKGFAFDASAMEEDTSNLAGAAGSAADGLDSAADSAKQLRKELSVLPFDELNQLNKDNQETSSGTGSGGDGGVGGIGDLAESLLDWGDLLNNSEVGQLPDAISEWAERIKKAFKAHDWEKLGEELAWGVNKAIDSIYDALDINKFKEKVDPFIDGFTRTFNSFIRNVNWEKLGRTVGRGVNDIVYLFNQLLTRIDWVQIGRSMASGMNGLIREINFTEVGRLIGNKFMVFWKMLYGFAEDFDWKEFGRKLGSGINGINDAISWTTVGKALSESLNGLFTTLGEMAKTIKWDEIAKNITSGINTFITNFDWKENGKNLGSFLDNLCDTLISIIDETNWEELGQGIADFLAQLPWGKMLTVVAKAITSALGGLLKGMASTPSGAFMSALIAGMVTFKIGSKLDKIVTSISNVLTGSSNKSVMAKAGTKLASKFKTAFTKGLSLATGTAAGQSLLIGAGLAAIPIAAGEAAKGIDKLKGGNGILTDVGRGLHEYTDKLRENNTITDAQKKAIDSMIESREKENMTESEASTLIDDVNRKLGSYGITADEASGYLSNLYANGAITDEMYKSMSSSVQDVNAQMDKTRDSSGSASVSFDSLRSAVNKLGLNGFTTDYQLMLDTINKTQEEGGTAEGAYRSLQNVVKSTGGSVTDLKTAVQESSGQMKTTITNDSESMKSTLSQKWGDMKTNAATTWSNILSDLKGKWSDIKTDGANKFGSLKETIVTHWSNLKTSAGTTWETIKTTLSTKWETIKTNASTKFDSIKNHVNSAWDGIASNVGTKWDSIKATLSQKWEGLKTSASETWETIKKGFSELPATIQGIFDKISISMPKIKLPQIGWDWEPIDLWGVNLGYYPKFKISGWFKKGGLFKGGKGQIIGVGEDGRDEAVLPLEDERAMSRIGSAIANASQDGGLSITRDDIVDAVVTAMAMNPQSQEVIVNAVLKMENDEVLARHVERGRQRLDSRYNPVAQY